MKRLATQTESVLAADSLIDRMDRGLRVVVADENKEALEGISKLLRELGHDVVARETSVDGVAAALAEDEPELAMVKLHGDDEHALDLIQGLVDEGGCPVVALLDSEDADFIARAAERGIVAYAQPVEAETV